MAVPGGIATLQIILLGLPAILRALGTVLGQYFVLFKEALRYTLPSANHLMPIVHVIYMRPQGLPLLLLRRIPNYCTLLHKTYLSSVIEGLGEQGTTSYRQATGELMGLFQGTWENF